MHSLTDIILCYFLLFLSLSHSKKNTSTNNVVEKKSWFFRFLEHQYFLAILLVRTFSFCRQKRVVRAFVCVFILSFFAANSYGQTENPAALKQEIQAASSDAEQFRAQRKLTYYYRDNGNIETYGLASQELLRIAQKSGNDSLLQIAYGNLGNYFANRGDFHSTLVYYLKALPLAERLRDAELVCRLYNNVADQYRGLKNYPQAIVYLRKAQLLFPKVVAKAPEIPAYVYINFCESFLGLKNSDSALRYIKLADAELQKNQSNPAYTNTLFDYGLVYDQLGQTALSEEYFRKSIALADSLDDLYNYTDATRHYSNFLFDHRRYADVRRYALQSLEAAQKTGNNLGIINAAALLYNAFLALQQRDSAFYYLVLKDNYRDTVFNEEQLSHIQGMTFNEQLREQENEAERIRYQNRMKIYSLIAATLVLFIVGLLLWRNIRYKQKAFRLLELQKQKTDLQKLRVEKAYAELKATQTQLIHREKMASLGELTAGIAHEIQNPLNFINNFSDIGSEMTEEIESCIEKGNAEKARQLLKDLQQNLEKISHHGKRADVIIKNMLQHSRSTKVEVQAVEINPFLEEYLRLSYHGMRAKDKTFNATLQTRFDASIQKLVINPQDMGRVLLNLFTNAFHSVHEKQKSVRGNYEPTITVSTKTVSSNQAGSEELFELRVRDNGNGIAPDILDKIYQPFFTTKPSGQGTGLGLSLSYDIITKGHKGDLRVETKEGEYAEFIIQLPYHSNIGNNGKENS